jgi:hypothetical protein
MSDATEIPTLAGTMDELAGRGFTEHFILANGKLRAATSGKVFTAEEVLISEYHRFEGVSDPDDMAILYALETRSGLRGTLADAFGVYADPMVGAFMKQVVRGARPRPGVARGRPS